ncbi:hypothetical protein NC652_000752 [Populus alba x Populus x berolinensis]|nr:hypothetical protein NC652_000752 [Populus alba x Populus x berolinensis]
MEKENARIAKKERRGAIAKKVVDIYSHDLDYYRLICLFVRFFSCLGCIDANRWDYILYNQVAY